jgi:hypothetical protein
VRRWGRTLVEAVRRGTAALARACIARRRVLGHAVGAAALVAGSALAHQAVHRFLSGRPEFQIRAPGACWSYGDGALPEMTRGADEALAGVHAPAMDETMIPALARRILEDPWIRSVSHVRRVYPRDLELSVEFRRPYVAVRHEDDCVLLDAEGVVLPGRRPQPPVQLETPVVTGTTTAPPPPGRRWESPQIEAAYRMLRLRERSMLRALPIASLEVSDAAEPEGCRVRLRLQDGRDIPWGAAPDPRTAGAEAETARRLEQLRRLLSSSADAPSIF